MVKRFLLYILTFIILLYFALNFQNLRSGVMAIVGSPCDIPLTYTVTTVDPEFNLSKEAFTNYVKEAAGLWNVAYNKSLLEESVQGEISINLIYDERQSNLDKIKNLEDEIGNKKNDIEADVKRYQELLTNYNDRAATFEAEVRFWNSRGGAPSVEFNRLKEDQKTLQSEAAKLNALAEQLNLNSSAYNVTVGELNETVEDFNENLKQKPEEGIYLGNEQKIIIYIYTTEKELVHTIAHELGHALGVGHIEENPQAIMYPYTTQIVTLTSDDVDDLKSACRFGYEVLWEKLQIGWQNLLRSFSFRYYELIYN